MDRRSSGDGPPWFTKRITATRALDPYGLDAGVQPRSADVVSDLVRLVAVAEQCGLRPARAERWRKQLLTSSCSRDLLARCEHRLRGWLIQRIDVTIG
jgi:hypothetical protein